MPYTTDAERWQAVQQRDTRAVGAFWYAVKSTGIYCRPGCPARLPARHNVVFHATPEAAELAGYRACLRCHPKAPAARHTTAVVRACRLIERADTAPALSELADAVGLSRSHFHRVFKAETGVTPHQYAVACRAARVRNALRDSANVTTAIHDSGFSSSGRFYAASTALLGMTPHAFRAGGTGETIRFGVGACSLGAILVAATARGVCALWLGDDPDALVRELQDRFCSAHLVGGDPEFEHWMALAVASVESPCMGQDLPLDVRGTAFQQRTWQTLRTIPFGATASYAEVAARLGMPRATRAVANACGANPVAVVIPCHRVVRRDGAPGGYRWGVARKQALLAREQQADDSAELPQHLDRTSS